MDVRSLLSFQATNSSADLSTQIQESVSRLDANDKLLTWARTELGTGERSCVSTEVEATPSPILLKPKKKAKTRAKILRPGELTLAVYGADEAVKWERRIMHFIQKTSPVLGARKYDQAEWKSSVVDSMVGAYLTQNVTDALSSKAYMNLMAKFPQLDKASVDSIDWAAVSMAEVEKIHDAIRCRGMYNALTTRIKEALLRIRRDGRQLYAPPDSLQPAPKRQKLRHTPPKASGPSGSHHSRQVAASLATPAPFRSATQADLRYQHLHAAAQGQQAFLTLGNENASALVAPNRMEAYDWPNGIANQGVTADLLTADVSAIQSPAHMTSAAHSMTAFSVFQHSWRENEGSDKSLLMLPSVWRPQPLTIATQIAAAPKGATADPVEGVTGSAFGAESTSSWGNQPGLSPDSTSEDTHLHSRALGNRHWLGTEQTHLHSYSEIDPVVLQWWSQNCVTQPGNWKASDSLDRISGLWSPKPASEQIDRKSTPNRPPDSGDTPQQERTVPGGGDLQNAEQSIAESGIEIAVVNEGSSGTLSEPEEMPYHQPIFAHSQSSLNTSLPLQTAANVRDSIGSETIAQKESAGSRELSTASQDVNRSNLTTARRTCAPQPMAQQASEQSVPITLLQTAGKENDLLDAAVDLSSQTQLIQSSDILDPTAMANLGASQRTPADDNGKESTLPEASEQTIAAGATLFPPQAKSLAQEAELSEQRSPISAGSEGELDLEWLRKENPDLVRQHLMSFQGLGRKSVACIMLLALGFKDFPVDTNVGRICARLGWLPLDAEKALEDLDDYAPEPEVHQYLKDRMMRFDVSILYELHYLMITMGKVFCSKKDPNCSACPLQGSCEYALNHGKRRAEMNHAPTEKREGYDVPAQSTLLQLVGPHHSIDVAAEGSAPKIPDQELAANPDLVKEPVNMDSTSSGCAKLWAEDENAQALTPRALTTGQHFVGEDTDWNSPGSPTFRHTAKKSQSHEENQCQHRLEGGNILQQTTNVVSKLLPRLQLASSSSGDLLTSISASDQPQNLATDKLEGSNKGLVMDMAELEELGSLASCLSKSAASKKLGGNTEHPTVTAANGHCLASLQNFAQPLAADIEDIVPETTKAQVASAPAEIERILNAQPAFLQAQADVPFRHDQPDAKPSRLVECALQVLGLTSDGSMFQQLANARRRYLHLSVLVHPDKNPSQGGQQAFDAIRAAWEIVQKSAGSTRIENACQNLEPEMPLQELSSGPFRKAFWAWEIPEEHTAAALGFKLASTEKTQPCLLLKIPASAKKVVKVSAQVPSTSLPQIDSNLATPEQLIAPSQESCWNSSRKDNSQPESIVRPHEASRENLAASQTVGSPEQPSEGNNAQMQQPETDQLGCFASQQSCVRQRSQPDLLQTNVNDLPGDLLTDFDSPSHQQTEIDDPGLSLASTDQFSTLHQDSNCRPSPTDSIGGKSSCLGRGPDEELRSGNAGLIGSAPLVAGTEQETEHCSPIASANSGESKPARDEENSKARSSCDRMDLHTEERTEVAFDHAQGVSLGRPELDRQASRQASTPSDGDAGYVVLVPCGQAMNGRFPLHGTYFQTNEVFLDSCNLLAPNLEVTDCELNGWKKRQVLFGSSIGSISRGMKQKEVAFLFKSACICVRAYHPITRQPLPLPFWVEPHHAIRTIPTSPRKYTKRAKVPGVKSKYAARNSEQGVREGRAKKITEDADEVADRLDAFRPPIRLATDSTTVHGLSGWGGKRIRTSVLLRNRKAALLTARQRAALEKAQQNHSKAHLQDSGRMHKRQQVFPKMMASQRCGHCKSCLNPALKKACYTRRAELIEAMRLESTA